MHALPDAVVGQHVDLAGAPAHGGDVALLRHGGHACIGGDEPQPGRVLEQPPLPHALNAAGNPYGPVDAQGDVGVIHPEGAGVHHALGPSAGDGVHHGAQLQHVRLLRALLHPRPHAGLVVGLLFEPVDRHLRGPLHGGGHLAAGAFVAALLEEHVVAVHVVGFRPGDFEGVLALRRHGGQYDAVGGLVDGGGHGRAQGVVMVCVAHELRHEGVGVRVDRGGDGVDPGRAAVGAVLEADRPRGQRERRLHQRVQLAVVGGIDRLGPVHHGQIGLLDGEPHARPGRVHVLHRPDIGGIGPGVDGCGARIVVLPVHIDDRVPAPEHLLIEILVERGGLWLARIGQALRRADREGQALGDVAGARAVAAGRDGVPRGGEPPVVGVGRRLGQGRERAEYAHAQRQHQRRRKAGHSFHSHH